MKRTLIIEKPSRTLEVGRRGGGGGGKNKKEKSRQFSAELLAYVTADGMWPGGQADTDNQRPIWAMLGGTEQELRSFVANLQMGHLAALPKEGYSRSAPQRYEFLKTAGYRYLWQKVSGLAFNGGEVGAGAGRSGSERANDPHVTLALVTIYQVEWFRLDPGMIDPFYCRFVMLPPAWWVTQELARLRSDELLCARLLAHARALGLHEWEGLSLSVGAGTGPGPGASGRTTGTSVLERVPQAVYFAGMLDRRTQKPLPDSLQFALQLYFYALREGIATLSLRPASLTAPDRAGWDWARHQAAGGKAEQSYLEVDTDQVGLLPGVAVDVSQTRLSEFLARQVKLYFETIANDRHLLSASSPFKAGVGDLSDLLHLETEGEGEGEGEGETEEVPLEQAG